MLGTSEKKTRKRFNLLLLEERDHYFEDYGAYLHLPPSGNNVVPLHERKQLKGRIHVSSKNIFFEPESTRTAIYRFSLRNIQSLRQGGVGLKSHTILQCSKYAMITPNQPFTFVSLAPNSLEGEFAISLLYTSNTFQALLAELHAIEMVKDHELSQQSLEALISQRQQSIRFDLSRIQDVRERVQLPGGQAVICSQITPLVSTAGCLLLTDKRLYFQPFNNVHADPVQSFALNKVEQVYTRRYCMSDVGLEIYLHNPNNSSNNNNNNSSDYGALQASFYFCFKNTKLRDVVYDSILGCNDVKLAEQLTLTYMLSEWSSGRVSNQQYLMFLNQRAGRSFQDLSQYPVMPWVITDFSSQVLNLGEPGVYRDLSKPIGALNPQRLEYFKQRRTDLPDDGKRFLYGTHYSTPGYVLYYLVRRAPQYQLRLQNGRFDHADRQFLSIGRSWQSCVNSNTDVKELIPEFYETGRGSGDFLTNELGLPLGMKADGEEVDDVTLPPWASSPQDFVSKLSNALESDHVSANIHHWINLIFGVNATGAGAREADNEFYYLTYEDAIDLDKITDMREKHSVEMQIREFGQTPKQIFFASHPRRGSPVSAHTLQQVCGEKINLNNNNNNTSNNSKSNIKPQKKEKLVSISPNDLKTLNNSNQPINPSEAQTHSKPQISQNYPNNNLVHNDSSQSASTSSQPLNNNPNNLNTAGYTKAKAKNNNVLDELNPVVVNSFPSLGELDFDSVLDLKQLQHKRNNSNNSKPNSNYNSAKNTPSKAIKPRGGSNTSLGSSYSSRNQPSKPASLMISGIEDYSSGSVYVTGTGSPSSHFSDPAAISSFPTLTGSESKPSASTSGGIRDLFSTRREGTEHKTEHQVSWLDLNKMKSTGTLSLHRDQVTDIGLSSDGNTLYSVGQDSSLCIYSIPDRKITRNTRIGEVAISALIVPDSGPAQDNVVLSSWDNGVYLYSMRYGSVLSRLAAHDDAVSAIDIVDDTLLSGGWDATVKLWKLTPGGFSSCLAELDQHESEVKALKLSYNANTAVSGAEDGSVILWDLRCQGYVWHQETFHDETSCIQLSHDQRTVLVSSNDGVIKHLELSSGRVIREIQARENISSIIWDGGIVIGGGRAGRLRTWDVNSGIQLGNLGVSIGGVSCMSFKNERMVVGAGCSRNNIEMFSLS